MSLEKSKLKRPRVNPSGDTAKYFSPWSVPPQDIRHGRIVERDAPVIASQGFVAGGERTGSLYQSRATRMQPFSADPISGTLGPYVEWPRRATSRGLLARAPCRASRSPTVPDRWRAFVRCKHRRDNAACNGRDSRKLPLSVGERSGQSRLYVRPVVQSSPAGHHGCGPDTMTVGWKSRRRRSLVLSTISLRQDQTYMVPLVTGFLQSVTAGDGAPDYLASGVDPVRWSRTGFRRRSAHAEDTSAVSA